MPSPLMPTAITPASYTIISKHNVLRSESVSGKILTRKIGGQRFEFTLAFPPMTRSQFSPIHAFLMEQEGSSGIFYVQIPTFSDSATTAGEYCNYSGSTKLYLIKTDGTTLPALHGTSVATTYTNAVTIVNSGGNKYVIDGGSPAPVLELKRGDTHIFDQSDASNSNHPLRFKTAADASYNDGVVVTGTPGQYGASVAITVAANAPDTLKYYCTLHGNGMGNTINVVNTTLTQTDSSVGAFARVSLVNNVQEISYGVDGIIRFEIDLVERL